MSSVFEPTVLSSDATLRQDVPDIQRNKVAYIDIIPQSLFITSAVEQNLRSCAKTFSQFLDNSGTDVRLVQFVEAKKSKRSVELSPQHALKSFRWWKLLPNLNLDAKNDKTPFVTAWQPILRIKNAYENLQCKRADVARLSSGFFGISDDKQAIHQDHLNSEDVSINLRIGVPTVDCSIGDCLIATPPSLAFALDLLLEICRSYVEENDGDKQSNLSKETIGVLENWIDFITRGTLIFEDSDKLAYSKSVWMRSNPDGNQINCFPSPVTIFIECEDPICLPSDDELNAASVAWRSVVKNRISDGSAIIINEKDINKDLVNKVRGLCRNRLLD